LLSACYRNNMIRKCFNEEVKRSNKNWKVNGSAVCFLYICFLCYFYSRSLYLLINCFLREKVGGSEKSRLLAGSERNRLLALWVVWKMVSQTSQILFEMITICPNTSFKSCLPLVSCIVHHALLELTPRLNQLLTQLVCFCISLGSAVYFQVKWTNLQSASANFPQESVYQKLLTSVHFWPSYSKNKKGTFLGHSIHAVIQGFIKKQY